MTWDPRALLPLALLAVSTPAPTGASDVALAPQLAQLQDELTQLRARVDQMEGRPGPNGPDYRFGSPTSQRVELRGSYGSIVIDRDGVAIQADKVRINGKTIAVDAVRTLNLAAAAVVVRGDTVDMKGTSTDLIKGSKIGGN